MKNRLREARFLSRKTQDQLHIEIGMCQAKISRIERGFLKASEEEKKKLAKALGVKKSWLFLENE